MSADQITPDECLTLRRIAEVKDLKLGHGIALRVLNTIDTLRAEVQRLKGSHCEILEVAARNLGEAVRLQGEVQRLTERNVSMEAEIRILTEQSHRSDAGRVEVPERAAWLTIEEMTEAIYAIDVRELQADVSRGACRIIAQEIAKASIAKGSRLSPSPQPSADVVVVPRSAAEFAVWAFDCIECPDAEHYEAVRAFHDALRSSTNHDAQDAAQPTTNDETRG